MFPYHTPLIQILYSSVAMTKPDMQHSHVADINACGARIQRLQALPTGASRTRRGRHDPKLHRASWINNFFLCTPIPCGRQRKHAPPYAWLVHCEPRSVPLRTAMLRQRHGLAPRPGQSGLGALFRLICLTLKK